MKARHIIEATVFGSILTLGAPLAAGAQAAQQESEMPGQQAHEQEQRGQQAQQQKQAQSIQGTVSKVESDRGELTLRTEEGEEMKLHGKPTELEDVSEGDQVRARYQEFGSEKWLQSEPRKVEGGPAGEQGAQQQQPEQGAQQQPEHGAEY